MMSLYHWFSMFLGVGALSGIYVGGFGMIIAFFDIVLFLNLPLSKIPSTLSIDSDTMLMIIILVIFNIRYMFLIFKKR